MQKFPVDFFYLVKLKKIESSHNNLRVTEEYDNSVVGYAPYLPKKDISFLMFAKGLKENSVRIIKTTPVQDLTPPCESDPRTYVLKTENSEYSILILDKVESSLVEDFIETSLILSDPAIEKYMDRLDQNHPKIVN
jgi:hypothetical protein